MNFDLNLDSLMLKFLFLVIVVVCIILKEKEDKEGNSCFEIMCEIMSIVFIVYFFYEYKLIYFVRFV